MKPTIIDQAGMRLAAALLAFSLFPSTARLQELAEPSAEAKSYIIGKFSKPESDPLVEAARDVILARTLARHCDQERVDQDVLRSFLVVSGLSRLKGDRKKEVLDDAGMRFDYLDIETLHTLCFGIDQFFGSRGELVQGLMRSTKE